MYELYDFQKEIISESRREFVKNKRVICCAPTGAGKTVIASSIADASLKKGKTVCIVCHRIEILQQFYTTLSNFGIQPELIVAGQDINYGAQIYLAMVETFKRRMLKDLIRQLNIELLILDEVHWGAYRKICHGMGCFILGLSATPKTSATTPLNDYFDSIVCPVTTRDLISSGHLVDATTYSIDYDFSKLKMRGGDYSEESLWDEFRKPQLFDGAIDNYLKYAKGKKAICYNVNVEHSIAITERFIEAGIKAIHIDATTSERDRAELIECFRNGFADVLCNVGIATCGFDEPTVECIIENRATTQLTLHVQMTGRGARCCEGKRRFIVIDMGRNYMRHGLFGENINWRGIFHDPREDKEKKEVEKKGLRECKSCCAIIRADLDVCPYCDVPYTEKEKTQHFLDNAEVKEIKQYKLETLPADLRKPIGSMNKMELTRYANHMGYANAWVHVQWNRPWLKKRK